MLLRPHRSFKASIDFQAQIQSLPRNSNQRCKSLHRKVFARPYRSADLTAIGGLLQPCSPPTISRFITFFIVNTINCVLDARSLPHIFKEKREVHPTLTHRYSAGPICPITKAVRIKTASFEAAPRRVSWSVSHSMSFIHLTVIITR